SLFGDMLSRITETGRALIGSETQAPLIDRAEALFASDGEVTGTARARALLDDYAALPVEARHEFLREMAARFAPDMARVARAVAAYEAAPSPELARALHIEAEPRSQQLLRLLNRAPQGTLSLVRMREDLLSVARGDPALEGLDADFRHLFASWFNRGFLELRRMDWQTPAAILEKIIQYEAVHAIQGWHDLRRRVAAPDRQLYGFFHPALGDEPLIFVEVALCREIPGAIGPILAEEREALDPKRATTAAFYSISNCQNGLRGVSFGSFLIKQVVEELRRDVPTLSTFVTLSPVPGLTRWLAEDEVRAAAGEEQLAALAAHYLTLAKRPDGRPLDPVARFHLGNGARLERVNPTADASERGQRESRGVMVNYLYDLRDIERNHEAFAAEGEIAQSSAVRRLARQVPAVLVA
ncbi:MAG: malonyl-CoA decarboxylase, partial [Pseudomonadota bacterium]